MNEIQSTREINGCIVTIAFSDTKNPDLKRNLLWELTRCYEERLIAEAGKMIQGQN